MITQNKGCKIAFLIFSLACFIAIGVCLICDFALNKGITWAAYPLVSVPFAWLTVSALLLAGRWRIVWGVLVFGITLFPFLYLLERITPVHGWLLPLAVPIAGITVAALCLTLLLIRLLMSKKWYLSASLIILYGVIVAGAVRYFVNSFLGQPHWTFDNLINLFACAAVAALLAIIGYSRKKEPVQ